MYPRINKRETGIKLRKIMDEHGITVKDVQEYLKLGSVQSVYHWLNGLSMPTVDNLYALSEYFKLPIDDMICGNRQVFEPSIVFEMKSSCDKRMYQYYSKICEMSVA